MNGAFYIGAVGLDAQQHALEVIANNVANINTTGFKRSSVRFSELMGATTRELSAPESSTNGLANFAGVRVSATPRVWSQGDLQQTGQPLDLAINGTGFLELLGPSGQSLLWRGGTMKVNPDGYLAAADGTPLRAMISVPQGTNGVTIGADGTVTALVAGETAGQQIGQLDLVMVKDSDSLVDAGNGLFVQSDPAGLTNVKPGEEGSGTLMQGALEGANVQLSQEMVAMLLVQRAYAANAQVVQAGDQLMSIANGLRR